MNNEYEVRYIETFYKDLAKISKYISIQLKNNIAAHNLITDNVIEIRRLIYKKRNLEKII